MGLCNSLQLYSGVVQTIYLCQIRNCKSLNLKWDMKGTRMYLNEKSCRMVPRPNCNKRHQNEHWRTYTTLLRKLIHHMNHSFVIWNLHNYPRTSRNAGLGCNGRDILWRFYCQMEVFDLKKKLPQSTSQESPSSATGTHLSPVSENACLVAPD